jgi:outer membrane protein assembly factor BamB
LQIKNTRTKTTAIALILALTIPAMLVALPAATAQSTRATYAYLGVVPNPTGVGQAVTLHIGITHQLMHPQKGWVGLTVTVTDPDGDTETLGPFNTDTTGGTGVSYTPSKTGTYYFQTHFPEQVLEVAAGYGSVTPANTTMLASDSEKVALTVTDTPIEYYPGQPLPTEYWSRPIDSQLREWSTIAGNWLVPISGLASVANKVALSNDAPESAHILWSKQLDMGGLVGGEEAYDSHGYYTGDAYEGKFEGALIIAGVLYYNQFIAGSFFGSTGLEQEVVAVDLHTGEELWVKNWNNTRLSFGQILNWECLNGHGSYALLWTSVGGRGQPETWNAYDPLSGTWLYGMTDVPSGTNVYGPNGEILRYTVDTTNNRLLRWNSTRVAEYHNELSFNVYAKYSFIAGHSSLIGTTLNASYGYDLNVSIPAGLTGSVVATFSDRIIGASLGATQTRVWGLSLKRGQEGTSLFDETWDNPNAWITGNLTLGWEAVDSDSLVGTLWAQELRQHYGISFETGELLWGPTPSQNYRDQFYQTGSSIAYGNLYASGVGGTLYCYNVTTGELSWTYNATDTYVEFKISTNWWLYITFISDGKIYVGHYEHSSGDPKPRGAPFICFNATTGDKIWEIDGAFRQTMWGNPGIIGDSIIATMDTYDQLIYAIGKGPSATTVTASPKVSVHGSSVLVEGTVTDISPGTEDYALRARFPNGVPAVSDESMSDWMLYVYKQFPRPANATGVPVSIDVLDSNGNYRNIGTTTSDANGFFSFAWQPDIPGNFTVYATFAGSKSYWGSHAETAFVVDEAPQATPPSTPEPAPMTDTYVTGFGVGIIITIVVVGAVMILMLRKR